MKKILCIINMLLLVLIVPSCKKDGWKPGTPLAKEKVKVGVVHISDPFSESSGYAYAHQLGIEDMKRNLGLADNQLLYKTHVEDANPMDVESAIRDLIAQGANIIFATSWGYMDACEKLAQEFPSVVFAHASGYKYNDTNFTNYFGRAYQPKYLSGIVAGMQTKTGKIGFVTPWGTENSEVTCHLNAFALGVERVNPQARVYIEVTNSWFDPMGEAVATRALIAEGCDVISQDVDSPVPQIEAEKAGVWGIGYNTDMQADAPSVVLTSVLWNWGAYYEALVQSVINGTFKTTPYFGSLKEGIVGLSPLNDKINWDQETNGLSVRRILADEQRRIESGNFDVFYGVMETNDGKFIGKEGENLPDETIHSGINWHYRTVIEL
jgi:basic membrane protein A